MKILFVINSMNMGGAEKLLVESIPFYERNNINVDILVLMKNPSLPLWKDLQSKAKGKIWGLTSNSIYNPLLIFSLIKVFRNYSTVHVHLFPALYWSVLAKLFSTSSIRMFYTEHSTHNKRRDKWYFKFIDKYIYSFLDKIIVISKDVRTNLVQHLGDKFDEKMCLIPNGIDVEKYAKAKPLSKKSFFSKDDFLIIQVSSFRYPKDQFTLIKALINLPENIKLLLVGDGHLRIECEQLVVGLQLQDRVKFLGLRTDIPELLKTTDVVVLSSNYEGMSLSSIEGMSSRPFLATDVPGLTEIVKDYGLLFKQGDSEELANHIINLYKDKEYYAKIAARCLERAKEYDIQKMVNRYIESYKKVLIDAN